MSFIAYLVLLPFTLLWLFLIWWLIKPKYFPFYTLQKIPSRAVVLGVSSIVYIALTMVLVSTMDTSQPPEEVTATASDVMAVLFSLLLMVLLGLWSRYAANKRKRLDYELPISQPPQPQPQPQPQDNEPRQRAPKEEASHTMVYLDSKGNLSEREINLRGVEAKNGKLYVNAYCFKRKRLRTFVAKNIISLRDYATDKTFTDEDEIYNELLAWVTTTQPHT